MSVRGIISRLRAFRRCTSGAALVEFVLVFPMMILFFAIVVEFGRLYWGYQSVVAGVRDASRYVARIGPVDVCLTDDGGGDLLAYMPGVTEDDLKDQIRESYTTTGANMLPSQFTVESVAATYACMDSATYRTGDIPLATVSASVTMQFPLGHLFRLFGDGLGSVTTTISDDARIFGT